MDLIMLYKNKRLNEIYEYLISLYKIEANVAVGLNDFIHLQDNLLKEVIEIKKDLSLVNSKVKEKNLVKKIVQFINFNRFLKHIIENLHVVLSDRDYKSYSLTFQINQLSDNNEILLEAIMKDTNISSFVNDLIKSTKNPEIYKVLIGLSLWFRTDINKKIRNSIESYQTRYYKEKFENVKASIAAKKENMFSINNSLYSRLNKETKVIVKNLKTSLEIKENFLKYDPYSLSVIKKDAALRNNRAFNAWLLKMKMNKEEEEVYSTLEDLVISLNTGSENIFHASNYLGYKLSFNKLIKNENDINLLYGFLMKKMMPMYKNQGEILCDKEKELDDIQKIAEVECEKITISKNKFKTEKIIENTFSLLSENLDFKFKKLLKIELSNEISYIYQIEYKKKLINVIFSLNQSGEINQSLISPYYSEDTISPNYQISVNMSDDNIKNDRFSILGIKYLFHELGHLFNMIYSNSADMQINTMESVEIPSIFMEEYLFLKENLQKILKVKISNKNYDLIINHLNTTINGILFRELTNGYIYNMLLSNIKNKGDIYKVTELMEQNFKKYNLSLNEDNLYLRRICIKDWELSYNSFDYVNTNFAYIIGHIVAKNMIKNQISLKKAFTNLFKYDMIKTDRYYWSKFVDF